MTGHRIPLERKLSSRALRGDRNKRWGSAAGQEKSCGNRAEMKTHCTVVLLLRYLRRQKRRESANDELRILSLSCCAFDWLRVNSLNVDWQLYQGNGNGKTILGDGGGWGWNSAGTGGDRKKIYGDMGQSGCNLYSLAALYFWARIRRENSFKTFVITASIRRQI